MGEGLNVDDNLQRLLQPPADEGHEGGDQGIEEHPDQVDDPTRDYSAVLTGEGRFSPDGHIVAYYDTESGVELDGADDCVEDEIRHDDGIGTATEDGILELGLYDIEGVEEGDKDEHDLKEEKA